MLNSKNYLSVLQKIKQQDVEVLLKKAYRGIWETAIKKYSDSAHFVYELLQNADDAKATWVEFTLEQTGLWFKHNGSVRFTISNPDNEDEDSERGTLGHINAITSIGNSTKIDEQKIGKFGIGFKAVFAYSSMPQIYDDNFNFKLENYIVPHYIDANNQKRKKGETLFYFPFNLKTKSAEEAYNEIEEKLESLFQPILFLSNLQKIKWLSANKNGEYSKRTLKTLTIQEVDASFIEVIKFQKGEQTKENLWLFSQSLISSNLRSKHNIVAGFFVLNNNSLETGYQYKAFCFFPTQEDTKLGFIIQAPFLLTDSREGIKAGDSWNIILMQLVAELAANSIVLLKQLSIGKNNFIADNILDLIPYQESNFSDINNREKISFKPFYYTILQKFKTEAIIPGKNNQFFIASNAYWASDPELAELFTDVQISVLMENPNSGWVFPSKGQKQMNQANKQLENYISSIVKEIIDPKKLLRRITASFIEGQTDEWLLRFYSYLGGRKSLWDDKDKIAVKKPILLNQDRKAIIPFDETLTAPNIFLPADRVTGYDTIYPEFAKNVEAMEFFKSLGLGQPDLKAEIFRTILPQYDGKINYENSELILRHFESFLLYYENCPVYFQSEYLDLLKKIAFVATYDPNIPGSKFFLKPQLVYFNDDKIARYFSNYEHVYFLDEDFYSDYLNSSSKDKFIEFLKGLGVTSKPKLVDVQLNASIDVKERFGLDNCAVSLTYFNHQYITDKVLEGLNEAVQKIDIDKSIIIWDYLLSYFQGRNISNANNIFLGNFKYIPKGNSNYKIMKFESTFVSIIKNDSWLFNKEFEPMPASELSRESLNERYNIEDIYANVLIEFLEIKNPDADLALSEEQKTALSLGRKLLDEGITQEDLDEFINTIAARKKAELKRENEDEYEDSSIENEDIDEMIAQLKKGIKKKRDTDEKGNPNQGKIQLPDVEGILVDQDEFTPASVDYQKKIDKLKLEAEAAIEDLTRIEKLNEIVDSSEKYSFAWFKALLELEYLSSSESNSQGKQISIQFGAVEKESGTERTLILKHPNRYIPQSIEDIGDLQIRIFQGDEMKSVTVEVVSVKEYTLRAKLKKSVDISEIDLDNVSRVVIDIKNPVFILEELRKAFNQLDFDDEFNLQQNLSEKIRFIFGPPGTGKTTHLAVKEIIPLMQKDEDIKILVLTPTNKAADVLTNSIIKKMGEDDTYYQWLLRFGITGDKHLETSTLLVDKTFDITTKPKNTTITTIARFAYDYFQPDPYGERLHLKFLQWDYIIIDEASMVNLPSISYILFQKKESNFIIAGDPFQIQPITQIEQWKDHNIYTLVQLDKFIAPVTTPHKFEIVNLQKQYRSVPSIGNVFSHFTYNGILEHHRTFADQKPLHIEGLAFKDINIIKFPVSKFESIYKPNTLNKSNYQIYSALFTVEFVTNISRLIQNTHKDSFRIGVICPYKAQATLIEKLLSQLHIDFEKIEIHIGTIHGFQGDECDIVIAIFNPPFSISKSPNMFLNKQNILNVSISRAKDYLFIFMPDDKTEDIKNLYKIKKIERLIQTHSAERMSVYRSEEIEEIMFGSKSFIYDSAFSTTHQSINVYSKPEKKYEVRCEEIAIDVQIKTI